MIYFQITHAVETDDNYYVKLESSEPLFYMQKPYDKFSVVLGLDTSVRAVNEELGITYLLPYKPDSFEETIQYLTHLIRNTNVYHIPYSVN